MKNYLKLYLILSSFASFKQNQIFDTLQQALKSYQTKKLELHQNHLPDDDYRVKVNTLNNLSMECQIASNFDDAKKYSEEALAIAQKIGYKSGIANSYNQLGTIFENLNKYKEALKYYLSSLKIREEIGDKIGIACIYNNIGVLFGNQHNYPEALKNHFSSIKAYENAMDKKGVAYSYNQIGTIYQNLGNYSESLKYNLASLKIYEEIGDYHGIAASNNSIGYIYMSQSKYVEALEYFLASLKIYEEVGDKKKFAMTYNDLGILYTSQGNYQEALKNYLSSLKIREEIGDKIGIAGIYSNIGVLYGDQGDNPEALKNHYSALKAHEEAMYKKGVAFSLFNIGFIYNEEGNYPEALKNCFAALKIAEEIGDKIDIAHTNNLIGSIKLKMKMAREGKYWILRGLQLGKEIKSLYIIKVCYKELAHADSTIGNFKGAYENYKLFIHYRDLLYNEEATKKFLQTNMQYEFDKSETKTKVLTDAKLKKQKLLRNGFIGGFTIVVLFALVFLRQLKKTKKEKLRAEEERKRSDELLLNILPLDVVDEIKTYGTVKAKAFTMVTVMFMDFKDFTVLSEKISAEMLVDEIHICFSAFDNILHKCKIEKIKTIGDAYLCAGGLPVSNHTHAVDILNAAFEVLSFMQERKKERELKGEIPFELRIGIHTGPLVAGVAGVKKYAYDIWGDTVNIAARMEQNSEVGKINISGATYELVKDKFKCVHRGKIQAKNKGEVDMYFVERIT